MEQKLTRNPSPALNQDAVPDLSSDASLPSSFSSFRRGNQRHASQFLRPARQTNFGGSPPWEWPEPKRDRNSLSVDRVGETAEEGPHRFTVRLGDTVRVWMAHDRFKLGRTIAISPGDEIARVQFAAGERGTWYPKERLYPAEEVELSEPEADEHLHFAAPMTGKQIQSLMRRNQTTIESLSERMQITQKRIREVRERGLADPNVVRDWVQGITGTDPGPIPVNARPASIVAPKQDDAANDHQDREIDSRRREAQELAERGLAELNDTLRQGKSETLLRYLDFLANFHNYSFQNSLLIYLQRSDATLVAGYRKWQDMGRHVKKGEKGISIFAPITVKKLVESGNATDDQGKPAQRLCGFRVVKVFDVAQTDGDTLPKFATISGDPGQALSRLEQLVAKNNIELRYEHPGHGALGTSAGGVIRVRPDLAPAERFSVLAHELGHEMLHWGERRHDTDKTVRETEAEAVAYTVCRACGVDSKARSSDYIALYRGNPEVLAESLQFIQHTAARIIEGLNTKAA